MALAWGHAQLSLAMLHCRHDWLWDSSHLPAPAGVALGHWHWLSNADGRGPVVPGRHQPVQQQGTQPWHQPGERCLPDREAFALSGSSCTYYVLIAACDEPDVSNATL